VKGSTSASGDCVASDWQTNVNSDRIRLDRPTGGGNRHLCPGGTLTVVFQATSPATNGSFTWTPALRGESEDGEEEEVDFTLSGSAPTTVVDGTAPTVTITQKPLNPSNSRSASFAFTVSEPASTVCKLDNAAAAPCSSPVERTGLADGVHTFTVTATDAVGNTGQASYTWTVDATAPVATILQKPLDPSNSNAASFGFIVSESAATVCKLDSAAFVACSSPVPYNNLGDGRHTFTLRAIDAAGNTGETSYSWRIETRPPTAAIGSGPPALTNSRSATFTFSADEPSSFACQLDGGGFQPCSSPASYEGLADGAHTFSVRPTDATGNTGAAASYSWTIETRAPVAAIASGPAPLTNSRSATFTFSADEPSSFACELDGGGFQPCSSPASYDGLGDGAHTFAVRPTDAAGNTGAASSHGWTIDATAPETTLASAPRSGTTTRSAIFTFSASEPASFECKLDAGSFAACTSPRSYSGLSRGAHSFEVRAIDGVGNVELAAAAHRWTIAAPRRARTTSALLTPRAGARLTAPPLLVWRRVARATYYNVQLFRGRVKVLSAWPTRPRLKLRSRWTYRGRQRKLSPGTYRWYVWPGYGRAAATRYGRLLGQSTFTVANR
ncbi:MAG TPA: hypothetical protein VG144_01635, partial [Gaiellaceae bacterium]|nr:hypothetical protein [Gaiellaceae bacterium]